MELVHELENFRLENKLSQEELARRLGVAFSTVNRWFNGRSQPNKIQSYHIMKMLNVKPQQKAYRSDAAQR